MLSKFEHLENKILEAVMEQESDGKDSTGLGKLVFSLTFVAMMVFFWWLLIYDHGVISIH